MPDGERFGRNVPLYGRDVIQSLGKRSPPIDHKEVADFLGYSIREITDEQISRADPEVRQALEESPAHLVRGTINDTIFVKAQLPLTRKRLSVFHECGHDQVPWHRHLNYYSCSEKDILKPSQHNHVEREAFLCGAEMMWPYHMFLDNLKSLPTNLRTIQTLAHDYLASREATAIRYVRVHPGICAIIAIERCSDLVPHLHSCPIHADGQLELALHARIRPVVIPQTLQNVYKVKYLSSSRRFDKYIPPGTVIPMDEPHLLELDSFPFREVELPISVLGSRSKARFRAESLILDQQSLMLILIWVPDKQGNLWR